MNNQDKRLKPFGSSKKRIEALASEKARLELLVVLMSKLSREKDLYRVVKGSLDILTHVIGSTNTSIHYQNDNVFHYVDLFNNEKTLHHLQDPAVISVWQSRQPVQIESDFEHTKMTYTTEDNRAFTWVYPIDTGDEMIGVVKFENTAYSMKRAGSQLDVFFRFLAYLLKNEIQKTNKLQVAYKKLQTLNAELENRVKERTFELERINQHLRESEAKYSLAFRGAPLLMTISSLEDGRYIEVNDTFVKTTGYTREEAIGSTSVEIGFISKAGRQKIIDELSAKGHVHELELELTKADGSTLKCQYSGDIIDVNGSPKLLSIAVDITHRKMMEEQIQKSQKMESIGNLAGGIAHDFNNILFPVVGMAELLMEDLPSNSLEYENAQVILKAGKRGIELVNQILTFSRQSDHKLIPVHAQKIVKDVLKLLRATIPTSIEINVNIQHDCGLVMADPTKIQQVVMNLITNAFHAVELGGGHITIALEETVLKPSDRGPSDPDPGNYITLSVSDNGHGIPEELKKNIFDPYFTTKGQGKGTGLGLAIVYGIVKEHNGDIRVFSEIGKGTTFTVFLPLLKKPDEADSVVNVEDGHAGNERILLVDDEESVVNIERQMLERMGYRVTTQLHSVDAYQAFKANPDDFDLVVTDMTMPSMTGSQLAEKILAIRPEMPIIVCTGFSEVIDKDTAEAIGIKGFLLKPVVRSKMAEAVRKVLDDRCSAQ